MDERAIVELVAKTLNLPCVHLHELELDERVSALLPPSIARRNGVLPLQLQGRGENEQLLLAMEDPLDIMAMDEIAAHVSINIQPVLVGPLDLGRALDRVYGSGRSQEQPVAGQSAEREIDFGELAEASEQGDEDSWAVFFDEAQGKKISTEQSSTISQEMRDRPSTIDLDMMDVEEILYEEDLPDQDDPLSMLDEPSLAHQNSGPLMDLDGWDLDGSIDRAVERSFEGVPEAAPEDPGQDYAEIGNFYVKQKPEHQPPPPPHAPPSKPAPDPRRDDPPAEGSPPRPDAVEGGEGGGDDGGFDFDVLFDEGEADEARSGTFVASPSLSLVGDLSESRSEEAPGDTGSQEEDSEAIVLEELVEAHAEDEEADPEPSGPEEGDGSHTEIAGGHFFSSVASPADQDDDEAGASEQRGGGGAHLHRRALAVRGRRGLGARGAARTRGGGRGPLRASARRPCRRGRR